MPITTLSSAPARPSQPDAAAPAPVPNSPFWALQPPAATNTFCASSPPIKLRPSQQGVDALLAQALVAETKRLLGLEYSLDRPEMLEQHAREQVDAKRRHLRQRDTLEATRLEQAARVNAALPA